MPTLLVTYDMDPKSRAIMQEAMADTAGVVFLADCPDEARAAALRGADALFVRNTGKELRPAETALIAHVRLVQALTAGVDYIPLNDLPPGVPVASNGGAYALPMAEHALAMALAAAKRLVVEHAELRRGVFNQFKMNRMLAGGVCGILGFGGIGTATARLMRAVGMRVHAINRSGTSGEPVDWIGANDRLDDLLAAADVLVVSTPLTPATNGMIGARELGLMKPDATVINLARGEVIQEAALYAHLLANPRFTACIDAWWVEPVRHGAFRMDHPFLELPNVIGSPHNSGSVRAVGPAALRRAAENVKRALRGETPHNLVRVEDRMM